MRTSLTVRSVTFAVLLLCSAPVPAQQLEEQARAILQKLELGAEWRPGFEEQQGRWGGVSLTSQDMSFSFHGPAREFTSFQWDARMTEIRNRGQYRGTAFRTDDELKARARSLLARLKALDGTWRIIGIVNADDPRLGGQQEFQGGAVEVKFGRVVNGLVAINYGAAVCFDSEDGKPVNVVIMDRDTTFGTTEGRMSEADAERRARAHATEFLTRTKPAEYANRLIDGFTDPAHTHVELIYGTLDEDFDGVTEPYLSRREVPPQYNVDLGTVRVGIHAVTGECLGGGVKAGAPMPPGMSSAGAGRSNSGPSAPVLVAVAGAILALGWVGFHRRGLRT